MNRYWLFLFPICFFALQPAAQQLKPADFDRYTTVNGLSDNSVTGLAQDARGYLWVATQWGLNRFDGHHFVQFHSNNDSASLPAEDLWGLTWLDSHRLAIMGTGIHLVDTRTGKTRNVLIPYHNKKYRFKFNMVMRVKGDESGNLYVLTRSGFYHFDKDDKVVTRFDYYSEAEVPVNHFFFGGELFDLDKDRLLISSINGLYTYHKTKKLFRKMTVPDCPLLAEFLPNSHTDFQFFQLRTGVFFVARLKTDTLVYVNLPEKKKAVSLLPFTSINSQIGWRSKLLQVSDTLFFLSGQSAGFFRLRFSPQTGAVILFPERQLENFLCTAFLRDKDDRLLIATDKGFLRQRTEKQVVQTATLPVNMEERFPNFKLGDVLATKQKVYAGSRECGLLVFDKKIFRFEENILFAQPGNAVNSITGLVPVNAGKLLLGTLNLPVLFQTKTNAWKKFIPPGWDVEHDWTSEMYRDSKNNIWINSQTIHRYNTTTGKFTTIPSLPQLLDVPVAVAEDSEGNIWLTCHGLARYNTRLAKYDLFIDSFPYIKIPDKQINALAIDAQNTVWFNSRNNGLLAYNVDKKTFRHFTSKDGLPDDDISTLIAVGDKVWIACYSGIACIDVRTRRISSFDKDDGFPDARVIRNSRFFYDSNDKQLYIGFANAVARFNPNEILQKKIPPQTFVESIVVNGNDVHYLPRQSLTTSWQDKELTVTIGSINFSDAGTQRYAYRIAESDDTPWLELERQPTFSISGLSPGEHRLQVKLYSATNRWPEQIREINLSVLPPLWLKPWFLVGAALLVLALLYFFIRWRIAVARRKEMQNTQIEKLKAENYKAQFELEQITHYFSSSLAGKKTEDEVLWDVASNLIGRMNYEDCIIYRWNKAKTRMVQRAAWGPKGKPELITADAFKVEPGQGIVGTVMQTRQAILVKDTRLDDRYRIDDKFRLSELAVPILQHDELIGIIDSENSQANYFSERDVKILTTIATLIGNKLKQLESEQRLEAKKRELAGINEQLAEARLSAQAQMNPHFVFNALNSIKRMILDADNEKASRYLGKFALMIRMTLEHSKETFVTLHENIQYLKAYLDMEKLRFDDTFTYKIHAAENVDTTETVLPSMMIQPLVENAIWHGLMYAETEKKLTVVFTQWQNKITCTVEDNGIGIRQSEKLRREQRPMHRSVGLENLQKRIKIMNEKYGTACSLQITDLKEAGINGGGTRAVLQLKLISN